MSNPEAQGTGGRRVVLATIGSLGDLHPFLALAVELKSRGHAPAVAANGYHRGSVEAAGIPFLPLRPDIADFGEESAVIAKVMDLRHGPEYVIRDLLMPHLRESYDDLDAACEDADLLVTHSLTFAGPLVAERRKASGLAWASGGITPSLFLSVADPPVFGLVPWLRSLRVLGPGLFGTVLRLVKNSTRGWVEPWHRLRAELGLPPINANPIFEGQFAPDLALALFSPVLAAPQPDWPPNTVVAGFPFFDGSRKDERLDPALEAFLDAGSPPIVFTLGSVAVGAAEDFYAQSAEAARKLGRRAVLLVGRDPRNLPPNLRPDVAAFEFAPHSLVFPRAAAIVHQGGIGTTSQALRAKRPMLVVPFGFDQPDNGARVERLGVARVVPRRQYDAERAARDLQRLLTEPGYMVRAAEIGWQVRNDDGAARACDALEALLVTR